MWLSSDQLGFRNCDKCGAVNGHCFVLCLSAIYRGYMPCDSFVGFGFSRDWALQHVLDIMIDIDFHAFPELFFPLCLQFILFFVLPKIQWLNMFSPF